MTPSPGPSTPAIGATLLRLVALGGLGGLLGGCIDYGVSRQRELDRWTQPARDGGVDVLWVVDDSMSMYEEQAQLAAHADSFIGFLTHVPVDFRLGVTSTDLTVEAAGSLLGPVLDADSADLVESFANQVANEALGSRDERGFSAALMAVGADGGGAELLRDGAALEVVFFSDEDDHSGLAAEAFVTTLEALKAGDEVVVNAIVGDLPEGCASLQTAADPGTAYVEAQQLTGGARESICAYDYATMLERMALNVLGLDDTFALSKVPDLVSTEVRVDGALIYRRDRHGWRYEAGLNAIVFDGYAVPPPGADIEIRYYEWTGNNEQLDTGAP